MKQLQFITILSLFFAPVVHAQATGAIQVTRHLISDIKADRSIAKRDQRIQMAQQIFKQYVDFDDFVRLTLHDHWDTLNDIQKMQFKVAFAKRLAQNVTDQVSQKPSRHFSAQVLGEQPIGAYTKVRCRIHYGKRTETIALFWTHQNGWKIADIETSGVGLAGNYQGQFNKIIRDHGFEELLRRVQSGAIK